MKPVQVSLTGCQLVQNYAWPTATAYAICEAESGGDPNATGYNTNGSVDRGLMQINSVHADMVEGDIASLYDARVNLAVAYRLYQAHGFSPWTSYTSGKYERYL